MQSSSYCGGGQSSSGGNEQNSSIYMNIGVTPGTGSMREEYPILRPPSTINVTLREATTTTGGLSGTSTGTSTGSFGTNPSGLMSARCFVPSSLPANDQSQQPSNRINPLQQPTVMSCVYGPPSRRGGSGGSSGQNSTSGGGNNSVYLGR